LNKALYKDAIDLVELLRAIATQNNVMLVERM